MAEYHRAMIFIELSELFVGERNTLNRGCDEIELLLMGNYKLIAREIDWLRDGKVGLKLSTVVEWVESFLAHGLYESSNAVVEHFPLYGQMILWRVRNLPFRDDVFLGRQLPYPIQHILLGKIQDRLEHACYSVAKKQFPDVLIKQRWSCPELFELTNWHKLFPKAFTRSIKGFPKLLQKLVELRHTAVHRVHLPISVILEHNQNALLLMNHLQDSSGTRMFSQLSDLLKTWEETFVDELYDIYMASFSMYRVWPIASIPALGLLEHKFPSLEEESRMSEDPSMAVVDPLEAVTRLVGEKFLKQIMEIFDSEKAPKDVDSKVASSIFGDGDMASACRGAHNAKDNRKRRGEAAGNGRHRLKEQERDHFTPTEARSREQEIARLFPLLKIDNDD